MTMQKITMKRIPLSTVKDREKTGIRIEEIMEIGDLGHLNHNPEAEKEKGVELLEKARETVQTAELKDTLTKEVENGSLLVLMTAGKD